MRKGRDGGKTGKKKKNGKKKKKEKRRMKIVATTSLPAVDRPNADRWNAARSRQKLFTSNLGPKFLYVQKILSQRNVEYKHILGPNKFFNLSPKI